MFKSNSILFIAAGFLAVVLGIASISNAALYLTVDGVIEPNGPVVLDVNETAVIGIWADNNTPMGCFFMGLQAGSGGTIDINDANMLYGGNMTSIEMVDNIEAAQMLDVNNPFVAVELIDLVMEDPLPLNGQLVDNITVTGPGTLLLFDGEGNPANVDEPNESMGQSMNQSIVEQTVEAISEPSPVISLRPASIERTTHLVYCPPEPNVPFDINSMGDFRQDSFGDFESPRTLFGGAGGGEMMLDELPRVLVNSDVTTNQIWTADNIYIINRTINVRALLVIEPGTIVAFSFWYSRLCVNNGGTLISCGTPDNLIYYTSDNDCEIFPEREELGDCAPPGGYDTAIIIEETASPATRIEYSWINYAYDSGIIIRNNRLDNPIRNNLFYWIDEGILEYGPNKLTDIVNNWIEGSGSSSIVIDMLSPTGAADANSHILIENNTCICQGVDGIAVYGNCEGCEPAGHVMIADNIVADSGRSGEGFGIHLWGTASWGVYNTGYYNNNYCGCPLRCGNISPADFEQVNPVVAEAYPFVEGSCAMALKQDGPFVDAGSQYIEDTTLVGKSTDMDGLPDCNDIDLGYHSPGMSFETGQHFVNAGDGVAAGDINKDAATDWPDLQLLCHDWLNTVSNDANDINNDGIVNFKDFAILMQTWFKIQGHPNIRPVVSGNPANLSGNVDVNVVNFGPWAWRAFVLMDGQFLGEIWDFAQGYSSLLETPAFRNGEHSIKAVTVDCSGAVTVSPVLDVTCNNLVHSAVAGEYFHPIESYKFVGLCDSTGNLTASLTNSAAQTIWSNTYSPSNVTVTIPGSSFGTEQLCKLSLTDGSVATKKTMAKKFSEADAANAKMAIILPNPDWSGPREDAIAACKNACDARHVPYVVLYHHDVTAERLTALLRVWNPNDDHIKYVYWCGHGNDSVGNVPRTQTFAWRSTRSGWWDVINNWEKMTVLSHTIHTDPTADPLPYGLDDSGFDLSALDMRDNRNKKIVFVDGCLTATWPDMAKAYGIGVGEGHKQVYIGWRKVVEQGKVGPVPTELFLGDTTAGIRMFWEQMGLENHNVEQALEFVYDHSVTTNGRMMWTFWGYNSLPDIGDPYGDDNFFVMGDIMGLNEIKLEP